MPFYYVSVLILSGDPVSNGVSFIDKLNKSKKPSNAEPCYRSDRRIEGKCERSEEKSQLKRSSRF